MEKRKDEIDVACEYGVFALPYKEVRKVYGARRAALELCEGGFCPLDVYDDGIWISGDLSLGINRGDDHFCWQYMGAHQMMLNGREGVRFAVWAPNVAEAYILGDFNNWQNGATPLVKVGKSNIWAGFVPGAHYGQRYIYKFVGRRGKQVYKMDPFSFGTTYAPEFNSRIVDIQSFAWNDHEWQAKRRNFFSENRPLNIYEAHLLSWKKHPGGAHWSYRELAEELPDYAKKMGYTHIEVLPITEHPFIGSMGYQSTGYFAPTARLGMPHDLQFFIDVCHQKGIGVILDFVSGHFCRDTHGLKNFTGAACFEAKERGGSFNRNWGTHNFNLVKPEVRSFLLASADFWLRNYHFDGLRVDAVADTIDSWEKVGKGEAAYSFFRQLNSKVYSEHQGVIMAAEDSSARKKITAQVHDGGLGFSHKWNMGWSFDTLQYMLADDHNKHWHYKKFTESFNYAFDEKFILPMSHDTVLQNTFGHIAAGKGERLAIRRLYLAYMMAYPGAKLTFMGAEWGRFNNWQAFSELNWSSEKGLNKSFRTYVRDLQNAYLYYNALWDNQYGSCRILSQNEDIAHGTFAFWRGRQENLQNGVMFAANFMGHRKQGLRYGVPWSAGTKLKTVIDGNQGQYGGNGGDAKSGLSVEGIPWGGYGQSVCLDLAARTAYLFAVEG